MAFGKKHEYVDERDSLPLPLDMLLTAITTVVIVVLMRVFVLDAYRIPSGSMLETIQLDDLLFGEKVSYYFRKPSAGEVITFDDPEDRSVTLIKRVIATEGQTVDLVGGRVYVDGEALDEPYVEDKPTEALERWSPGLDGPVSYPYTVPEGHLWVMGDNRTNSLDSRYFGAIDASTVQAHAILIFWPFADFGTL